MSNDNVTNEKKKPLLAYKEKILDNIKFIERSIDDFRANQKNKCFYDDHADSSDSEDDFASAIDMGPSITQLKLQQAMMKTCLHATQELTSLMVLQSEVDVLVEEPKFEGERPVTEAGTWREVTVECRIDLVPFTMTFFMHTPVRRFAPPSYRGLRVVPVKPAHELELSKSVLHSLKLPSDAVEVLKSYAAGYRSRRTTLARLANKYTNSLFMEPHAEGGFILKCADLLEVSWRLENKWSQVAPFHHRMKFDLDFMEESYIKIITQAHKQLLDPAIQTDERTLLLAKIITTCLEAKGTIDPESDLESKTTERDNDVDKRDSESEKRDSEVMAPPKSLPKKGKQKNKESLPNTAQKRSMDDENGDSGAKKMKNDTPEAKKSIADANNTRKSKINDVANEGGKKRKMSEANKVSNKRNVKEVGKIEDGNVKSKETHKENKTDNAKPKNIRESDNNAKTKNVKEVEDEAANTQSKPITMKESTSTGNKNTNTKTKNKITKDAGNNVIKETNEETTSTGNKNANRNTKNKITKEAGDNVVKETNEESTSTGNKNTNNNTKNNITKEAGDDAVKETNAKPKSKVTKKPANVDSNTKSKNKIVRETGGSKIKDDSEKPADKNTREEQNKDSEASKKVVKEPVNTDIVKDNVNKAKVITTKDANNPEVINQNENNVKTKNIQKKKSKNVANTKSKENIDTNKDVVRPKSKITAKTTNTVKNIETNADIIDENPDAPKVKNVANTKNDYQTNKKAPVKNINVAGTKNDDQAKKVLEKNIKNKEKLSEVANKRSEKTIKEKTVNANVKNDAQTVKKVTEKNATNIRNKDKISQITKVTEKVVKDNPIKNVPEKVINSNLITEKTKQKSDKHIIKNCITHKISSHRNSLKPQNPPKVLKAGNTKTIITGSTEKENGGKGSKLPQKILSTVSEGSSKKNLLRISPRKIPSKFKTTSQQTFKQKMMKSTNIPRLLKKPAPKT